MSLRRRPLYVWQVAFRLSAETVDSTAITDLEERLNAYAARATIDHDALRVTMHVVGHLGPASAIGDAAQQLEHHAANVGIQGAVIQVVRAERSTATNQPET